MFSSFFSTKRKYSNVSFTLLEVIIALFIISLGVIGVFYPISQIISFPVVSSHRLIAAYLAQEGIEIVRNIRDNNWLNQRSWKDGLGDGNWEVDYNDLILSSLNNNARLLKIDNNGFYNYERGINTPFKRKITISSQGTSSLMVLVTVQWQEKGKTNQIIVWEDLYNWK